MPTYVVLVKYTQQGIGEIKESPARVALVREAAKAKGGEVKAFYWTMGQYDGVVIIEMPGDEEMAALMLEIAGKGSVSTETLRAFTEEEFPKVLDKTG